MSENIQETWAQESARDFLRAYETMAHTESLLIGISFGKSKAELERKLAELIESADSACDWLCASHPGSDQLERGKKLKRALRSLKP